MDSALRLALIGDPVEHSLSPRLQTAALRAAGYAGPLVATPAPGDSSLDTLLRDLRARLETIRAL